MLKLYYNKNQRKVIYLHRLGGFPKKIFFHCYWPCSQQLQTNNILAHYLMAVLY